MIIGIKLMKLLNNIIQQLYYIVITLLLREKNQYTTPIINYCHNFIQRNIPFETVFKKIFINQTTFDVTFICIKIIC